MSFKLFLDSDYSSYKSTDTSPTDLNFNINGILSDNYDVYKLTLIECSAPNIEYVFQSGFNTSLVFRENGAGPDFTATITQGTYNGTDLATAIQSALNSTIGIANTYSCAYNQSTLKLTISTTIPNTFSIRSNSTCLQELGFLSTGTGFAVTQTSPNIVNLVGSRFVDICVSHPTQSLSTGLTQRSNILHRMKWDVPKGSIQVWQAQTPVSHHVSRTSLSTIEIRCYNDKARLMQMDANHKWTFTLLIEPVQ